jgi:Raf kinase inhibitor-like YbhB/YbcL family protein
MKLIIVSDFVRTLRVRAISTVMLLVAVQVLLIGVLARADSDFRLSSPAFNPGAPIPTGFSCTAGDHSPELVWSGAPAGTKSFALIVEDPDAPMGTFVHWVVFNLPASANGMAADAPKTPELADGATQGSNGMGAVGYKGPCPPPGKTHHYHFELFALDAPLEVPLAADAAALRAAMQNHVKGTTELVGTFER